MITAFLLGPILVLILFAILFPSAMRAVFIALFVMLAFYHFASGSPIIPFLVQWFCWRSPRVVVASRFFQLPWSGQSQPASYCLTTEQYWFGRCLGNCLIMLENTLL